MSSVRHRVEAFSSACQVHLDRCKTIASAADVIAASPHLRAPCAWMRCLSSISPHPDLLSAVKARCGWAIGNATGFGQNGMVLFATSALNNSAKRPERRRPVQRLAERCSKLRQRPLRVVMPALRLSTGSRLCSRRRSLPACGLVDKSNQRARANDDVGNSVHEFLHAFAVRRQEA